MIKKILILSIVISQIVFNLSINTSENEKKTKYKDGEYTGESRSIYTNEDYWGVVKIQILNNKITKVEFNIYDRKRNMKFDANYEKRYAGNQIYIDQCRKDWNGVLTYPEKFLKTQEINNVDAITGATWSYNIFKDALTEALNKAR